MYEVATDLGMPTSGFDQHFHVRLEGFQQITGSTVLLSGFLLDCWDTEAFPCSERVLVRIRSSDFYAMAKHARFL